MKKKSFSLLGLFLIIVLLFSNCQSDQILTDIDTDFHVSKQNPFDYVGSLHNQSLDFFINNHKEEYKTSVEEMFELSGKFCLSQGLDTKSVERFTNEQFINFWREYEQSNDENQYLLDKGYISQNGYKFLELIDNTFENITYDNELDGIQKIKQLETKLIQNQVDISQQEKEILLAALSVGRYSLVYWAKEFRSQSKWRYRPNTQARVEAGGSDIVREDVKGAVGGGLTGALIGGTATLGTATIPAWAAGAIIGGAVASVAESAAQLWDSFW